MALLIGSICLSNIPKEQIKKVKCKDGIERLYLNVAVCEKKEKGRFGDTHFLTCAPKKEERKDGVNYIIGDLKQWEQANVAPTTEEIEGAPVSDDTDLPF